MIRSFQNADLPILHRLWIEQWSALGPAPAVRQAQIEQAVLARTFFRADELLIAQRDGDAMAWLHFCQWPSDPELFVIPAICLGVGADLSLGNSLLLEAQQRITAAGAKRIQVGVVRDDQFGYAGLDPIGHGIGISNADVRLQQLLENAGYQVASRNLAMMVSVAGFRPPVSREGLLYRRSTRLEVGKFCYQDPRHAAGMSHLDVEPHCLVDRTGQTLANVDLWLSDPEAEVMRPSMMILDIGEAQVRGRLEPAESYLIGASIQAAASRNILSVETSVDEDKRELVAGLETLQFRPSAQGKHWQLLL